ncbi:MAG: ATP-binding protein [Halobacteriales archaeon]
MPLEASLLGYVGVFGAAALACFLSVPRARQIEDPDTRRGIVWLLLTSGGWASAHLGFLVVPTVALQTAFYVAGLVVGLAAVGAWLYFCSAFTGRALHRNRSIRLAAVAAFVGIVLVKVTNPLHGLYFSATVVAAPFPHLAVENHLLHWLVMGLSYALAAVGYFMLLEHFLQVGYDTRPFVVLVSITGLPVVLDVIGMASPQLIEITYEPIGVAIFAVGVFYAYVDRFQAIQLAGERDDAVIVLNRENQVRDYNTAATDLFPALDASGAIGRPLSAVLPAVADTMGAGSSIIELERDGSNHYYRVTESPFGAEQAQLGRLVTLTDVTEREGYRRELERQNERLDQFATMVSHDLRNPLSVAMGRLELEREEHDSENLEAVARALDRMEALIDDVLQLARQGQPISDTETVQLSAVATRCWDVVDTGEADLVVEDDLTFSADPDRLQQLLENLYRNAVEHGGPGVTVRVGALDRRRGFYVADDGPGIPEADRAEVFDAGYTTDESGTGFGLAIVEEIVEAHGWTVRVTESADGGAQFEITGVDAPRTSG